MYDKQSAAVHRLLRRRRTLYLLVFCRVPYNVSISRTARLSGCARRSLCKTQVSLSSSVNRQMPPIESLRSKSLTSKPSSRRFFSAAKPCGPGWDSQLIQKYKYVHKVCYQRRLQLLWASRPQQRTVEHNNLSHRF